MSLLLEQLEKSKATKELLSFKKYEEDDAFWCGYVVDYSDTHVAIQHFTRYGKKDGVILHPLDDFQRIDYHDDYCKAMQCVIDYSDQLYRSQDFDIHFGFSEHIYLNILKQFEGNSDVIVAVGIADGEESCGYVLSVSEEDFALHCVGKMGEDLGVSIFRTDDVTSIHVDDVDSRKRNMLFKWRQASDLGKF